MSSHNDKLQTLLSERDAARKKVDEYANLVSTLSNELDFLHNNICFTCRWRFSPAQSSSSWRRLLRPSRRSPTHVRNRTAASIMSVDGAPPSSHMLSISNPPESTNRILLPSNQPIAETSVDSAETTGMIPFEEEIKENEHSNNVLYNPQVERKLDLDIVHTFKFNATVLCVNFSPNGKHLAVGLDSGKTHIYAVETCSQICVLADYSLKEEEKGIWTVKFSPGGGCIATGGSDCQIRIWTIAKKRVRAMLKGHTAIVNCLVFSPDSRSLVSSSYDQSLRIWCTRDGSLKRIINQTLFFSVSLSRDGRYVIGANTDRSLRIWDVRTGRLVMCWTGHSENIWTTVFSPDGKGLLSGSQDRTMKYWYVSLDRMSDPEITCDKSEILTFEGHTSCVNALAISPDSRWVLSGSDDRSARIWDARTAEWQCILQGHNNEMVWVVAFSPEGGHLVTGGQDSRVVLWKLECKAT